MSESRSTTYNTIRRLFFALLIVLLVVLIAAPIISFVSRRTTGNSIIATATPSALVGVLPEVPAPVLLEEPVILFQDQFEDPEATWQQSALNPVEYRGGALQLTDNRRSGSSWARPGLQFGDFVLDVDSRWLSGALGGSYGVEVRVRDDFALGIYLRKDGHYLLTKTVGEETQVIHEAFNVAIDREEGINHLRIEASGQQLRFFVNDTYLIDLQDTAPAVLGDIRLVVEKSAGTDDLSVAFDNLVVALYP